MGAVDYFLKIDTIEGESDDAAHRGEIEIESWSFGESQSGSSMYGKGSGTGRVSMQDFQFTKRADKASPKLMLYCCNGQHVENALLTARKAGTGPQEYFRVHFKNIIISSYQTTGSASTDIVPREQIAFNFGQVQLEYRIQDPQTGQLGGPIMGGYNLVENRKI
jgi:type VI secretion system secreted protein Hcp